MFFFFFFFPYHVINVYHQHMLHDVNVAVAYVSFCFSVAIMASDFQTAMRCRFFCGERYCVFVLVVLSGFHWLLGDTVISKSSSNSEMDSNISGFSNGKTCCNWGFWDLGWWIRLSWVGALQSGWVGLFFVDLFRLILIRYWGWVNFLMETCIQCLLTVVLFIKFIF